MLVAANKNSLINVVINQNENYQYAKLWYKKRQRVIQTCTHVLHGFKPLLTKSNEIK
jgi:hypothetical protein